MTSAFQELIQTADLTRLEQTIADYILGHFRDVCFMTSTKLAKVLGVSYSSVIRFTKNLGFSGYTEFQNSLREQYSAYVTSHPEPSVIPAERLTQSLEKLSQENIISTVHDLTCNSLQTVVLYNPPKIFEAATDTILNSTVKYIVGYRGCSTVSSFLSVILKDTLPMVFADPCGAMNTFDFLSDITEKDCLIAVSYPRYSKLACLAAKMAYNAGASVIAITDTPTAPIAKFATHLFTTPTDSLTFFNSQTASLFTAELLCTYLCKRVGNANESKLRLIDHYTSDIELY